jgi:hypothetical protein
MIMQYRRLGAASISRASSSWLSTIGSFTGTLGENQIVVSEVTTPQHALVQEPQCRDPNLDGAGLQLLLLQEKDLVTSKVVGA